MILWISLAIITILFLCRFMPGPKCLTYCKFRQLKFKIAKEQLREMTTFDQVKSGQEHDKFKCINFGDLSYDKLCKLYTNSRPYGCSELIQEQWFVAARNALRDSIAEKQLLE